MFWTTILLLLVLGIHVVSSSDGNGVPGTTQTISGYDTEMGEDAICWSSQASPTPDMGIPFPNGVLVEDFALADQVQLMRSCPNGTWLLAHAPTKFTSERDFRPRTLEWYNYTVKGRIDMSGMKGKYIISDGNTSRIALSIVACDTVTAGFCSPFVHDQANAREAAERIRAEAEIESGALADDGSGGTQSEVVVKKKKVYGNRHGDSHVHAPAVLLDVPQSDNPHLVFEFEEQIPMIINQPGSFFVIATLQFFTGGEDDDDMLAGRPKYRYDVSVALKAEERLVVYQAPATVLAVSGSVSAYAYAGVGLSSLAIIALLWQTIRNYKHQVLQLSQAPFLVLFLSCALTATISSLLLAPKNDFYCCISHPLVLIPLQCFYSISLARLWRINAVVSPLLRDRFRISRRQLGSKKSVIMCHDLFDRLWQKMTALFAPRKGFRKTVSPNKAKWIIFFGTFPQVAIQAIILVIQPRHKVVQYNQDQSIGRCLCENGSRHKDYNLFPYSLVILMLLVLVLLIMAFASRKLPSLLNESSVIYETTLVSVFLVILVVGVIGVTDAPTTSPDVQFILTTMLIWSVTLNSSFRIILPKLTMIWSGQTILVSQLVKDEKQKLRQSTAGTGSNSNVTGVSNLDLSSVPFSQRASSTSNENSVSRLSSRVDSIARSIGISGESTTLRHDSDETAGEDATGSSFVEGNKDSDVENGQRSGLPPRRHASSQELWVAQCDLKQNDDGKEEEFDEKLEESFTNSNVDSEVLVSRKQVSIRAVTFNALADDKEDSDEEQKKGRRMSRNDKMSKKPASSHRKIIVRQNEAPSKRLVLRMIELQDELSHVTERITTGLNVEPEDWESVRKYTNKLEDMFSMIEFDFETKDEGDGPQ